MPATNPRVSSVVDQALLGWLRAKAERRGVSVSLLIRDLLIRFRDEDEDRFWAAAGEERLQSFDRDKARSHEDAWR